MRYTVYMQSIALQVDGIKHGSDVNWHCFAVSQSPQLWLLLYGGLHNYLSSLLHLMFPFPSAFRGWNNIGRVCRIVRQVVRRAVSTEAPVLRYFPLSAAVRYKKMEAGIIHTKSATCR